MSVFTPLTPHDVSEFMRQFDLGDVLRIKGISGGSENTNYFVDCTSGAYVLTLVERGPVQDLPFFIALLDCLQKSGLPVPFAFRNREGVALLSLKNKPALLQPRLPGQHPDKVSPAQCAELGALLASLHSAACGLQRTSDRGPEWVLNESMQFLRTVWLSDQQWLQPCLKGLSEWLTTAPTLPQAVIHGDLFRDNAMFEGEHISGVIDFYNAATGWTLLELAICVNDWCVDVIEGAPVIDNTRVQALIQAYTKSRAFSEAEQQAWPFMLQLAALRFWLSRQQYAGLHQGQPDVLIKDPDYFRQLLKLHYSQFASSRFASND
ncbi:MAG: homoserine kinase [Pseudohongiella sp.]|nr:homoserine kinase [Pseudohongiella sp.]